MEKITPSYIPELCDVCGKTITSSFVDGIVWVISRYTWANVCPECHLRLGKGLGTGLGQMFAKNTETNQWEKVAG
jgi:hypothetical protein